jgi:hypothetical protein
VAWCGIPGDLQMSRTFSPNVILSRMACATSMLNAMGRFGALSGFNGLKSARNGLALQLHFSAHMRFPS